MKKLIALLLALTMVLGLAACGGSNTPAPAETEAPAPAQTEAPAPAPAPAAGAMLIDIFDDDVPLADVPKTGDVSAVYTSYYLSRSFQTSYNSSISCPLASFKEYMIACVLAASYDTSAYSGNTSQVCTCFRETQ